MATYPEIQALIRERHGFAAKSCWIAHVKHDLGYPMKAAPNRQGEERVSPCPPHRRAAIEQAIRDLG